MKVAVVGGGGREHAIIKKLKQSARCREIVALPGNAGIQKEAECFAIDAENIAAVVEFCVANSVEYVVVAPDNPLALGLVDALAEKGIAAFGPDKKAARIESSKVFSKHLMQKYKIPTASFQVLDSYPKAVEVIQNHQNFPLVIKADGLAFGKGVLICETKQQALEAVKQMMEHKLFGESGSRIVAEEFLTGPEVSVLAFCDGKTVVPMVSSMDHKRALDRDTGLNTGGMGAVAPNPFYTADIAQRCMDEIFLPTLQAMEQENCPFKGCLYFGLMLTGQGPKVIEYNCRFGDPEAQVVLPLLEGDLLEIMLACTNGTLTPERVSFKQEFAACVVAASEGYPGFYKKGEAIQYKPDTLFPDSANIYYAGVQADPQENLVTASGRVLAVGATGKTLQQALQQAYQGLETIHFDGMWFRSDIGKKALEKIQETGPC